MFPQPRQVELYETEDGYVPYEYWLDGLRDVTGRGRIKMRITRLEETGNLGNWRTVGGGVIKLIIDSGPGYRVYLGQLGARVVILLCGGDTSTETADAVSAKEYWEDLQASERKERVIVNAATN